MADLVDLKSLSDGEQDLVHADFRAANLRGSALDRKNFSGAKFDEADLEGADFSRSTLVRASFIKAKMSDANFTGCNASQTGFVWADFRRANFRDANFSGAIFNRCDLSGADLRGADFQGVQLVENVTIEGVVIDETTKFDGASILRPMIRNPAFKYYELVRGKLVRRASGAPEPPGATDELALGASRLELERALDESASTLQKIEEIMPTEPAPHGAIGHNGPPVEFALSREDIYDLKDHLVALRGNVYANNLDAAQVERSKSFLGKYGSKILV